MPYTVVGKNTMLDALGVAFVSAHTAAPGESGTSEVTGGTYARKSITFSAAAAGNLDSSNVPVLDIPAGTTVTHIGYWSAVTGGTFLASSDVTDETYSNAGTLTVTDADLDLNL
jgi:hypothetical protein